MHQLLLLCSLLYCFKHSLTMLCKYDKRYKTAIKLWGGQWGTFAVAMESLRVLSCPGDKLRNLGLAA